MCLAIPMKVIEVNDNKGIVEAGGIRKAVDFSLLGPVQPGGYVIVHAGFAIQSMNDEEALKTLALFDEMIRLMGSEKK
ncbi:MAG: HypC/HybG/HupF family hydrogenase formation chaperone [Desulfobacteraceae bacterium]|nr:HypC/HybG/HupF family hydrogenase formation chaperone [Desulfobacteraceae bacterium]MBC2756128.1 HypC/HybG/HupF family hydrogenase formation chaperone [Desulfobacteraceae bacterium]